jgi:hypothetical protein
MSRSCAELGAASHQLTRWHSVELVVRASSFVPAAFTCATSVERQLAPVKTKGIADVSALVAGVAGLVSGVAGASAVVAGIADLVTGVASVAGGVAGAAGCVTGLAGVAALVAGVAGLVTGLVGVAAGSLHIQMVLMVLRVMSSPMTKGKCSHCLLPMRTSTASMLPSISPFQGAIKVNFEQFRLVSILMHVKRGCCTNVHSMHIEISSQTY